MNEQIDSLSLLTLKCAPNIFDVSSRMGNVSIRDQIVRSTQLVRDLKNADPKCDEILIVGAGFAGVAAALQAAESSVKAYVLDINSAPFSQQAKCHSRYVGPFMYEWPASYCGDQHYPPRGWPSDQKGWDKASLQLGWISSMPMEASQLASDCKEWLSNKISGWSSGPHLHLPKPTFLTDVSAEKISEYVYQFKEGRAQSKSIVGVDWPLLGVEVDCKVEPKYIIFAAGMGDEYVKIPPSVAGKPFWCEDSLRAPTSANSEIGVFGGGDGALQDFLRATTESPRVLRRLLNLRNWSHDEYDKDNQDKIFTGIARARRAAGVRATQRIRLALGHC